MKALVIDRLLRRRLAPVIVGALSAGLAVAAMTAATVGNADGFAETSAFLADRWDVAVIASVLAVAGLVTVLVWRRLWRRGRDEWEKVVYDYGVRLGAPTMTLLAMMYWLWRSAIVADTSSAGMSRLPLVLLGTVVGILPLALCVSYFAGVFFAHLRGMKRACSDDDVPLVGS